MSAEQVQKIFEFINSLGGLPKGTLVFIWCIAFGWVMKRARWVDNRSIPLFVVLWGAAWLPLLSDFKTSAIDGVRVFIFTQVIVGGIVGFVSTLAYKGIKAAWKKFFGTDFDDSPSDPPLPKKDGSNVKSLGATPPLAPDLGKG